MSKKIIETAVKWLIYATFFVPLLVLPSSFIFPFIVPKILLFRSLTVLIITLYSVLWYINPAEYRPRSNWLNWTVLAFLVSFALSTFFGIDPYHSFWDNHERMLGLFTIIHYVAYFYICSLVFKTWEDWRRAIQFFLVGGSIVMFIGLLQVFNPDLLLNGGSDRVISTLGNSIYVGGYGLFLLSASVLLFLKEKTTAWKYLYAIFMAFAFIGIIYSGTRGVLLGMAFGVGLAMVLYVFTLQAGSKLKKVLIGAIIGGLMLVGISYVFRQSELVAKIPALHRVLNTSLSELQGGARVLAWGSAIQGWKERPVLGWGPNNFFYAFNAHYNPKQLEFGYGETWFDNAHNIIVNTLAVQGLVGLITYLSIFVAGTVMLVVAYKKNVLDQHVLVISLAYLWAHLLENVTVFENPTSYLYFMFWLAMVVGLTRKKVEPAKATEKNKEIVNRTASGSRVVVMVGIGALLIFIFNIQPARANMKTLDALKIISEAPEQGLPTVNEALSFNSPHIDDIRSDISRSIIGAYEGMSKNSKPATIKEYYNIAESSLLSNIDLHPLDIRNQLTLAQLYQEAAIQNNDVNEMLKAEKYLELTAELSPKRQQVLYNLAVVKLQLGRMDEAEKIYKQTISDDPKISEGYFRLAYMYAVLGKKDQAKGAVADAEKAGVPLSSDQLGVINNVIDQAATKTKK